MVSVPLLDSNRESKKKPLFKLKKHSSDEDKKIYLEHFSRLVFDL